MRGDSPSPEEDSISNKLYELDELDIAWLDSVNKTRKYRGMFDKSIIIHQWIKEVTSY